MGWASLGRETAKTIVMVLVLTFILRGFVVDSIVVKGYSMEPALQHGERLLVNKLVYRFRPPARGDVVVFRYPLDPSRDFVKRVVGQPGDLVEVRAGQVYINASPIDEPYLSDPGSSSLSPQIVPAGMMFVMGDNRTESEDSRYFGPVSIDSVKGRAFLIFWPPSGARFLIPLPMGP